MIVGQRIDSAKLERAKELRRQMTRAERALWHALRGNRLNGLQFRRRQVIDGLVVDFYCDAAAQVIEVDGLLHRDQIGYDVERDRILSERGLPTTRVTNEELRRDFQGLLTQGRD